MPSSQPPGGSPFEQMFLENLPLIEEIVGYRCRKAHFTPQEAEDFRGHVHVKLIEDDYAVFRKYRGRSSIRTYLATVITNLARDYQDKIWGKWRPSAEAERLGPVAVALERLLFRDGVEFSEACRILRGQGVTLSVLQLADLRAKLPFRSLRRFVTDDKLESEPDQGPGPDEQFEDKEREAVKRRVYAALFRAIKTLSKEDQILVRMWTEFKVSEIARILGVEQKPLYRRLIKVFAELKKALARQGIRRKDIEDLLGSLKSGRSDPEDRPGKGPRRVPGQEPERPMDPDDDPDEKE
jgi:RNA polymerase sigma factor (sigma-70 family)